MMPVIAYNLLQSIELLTDAAEHLADKCIDAERVPRGQGRRTAWSGSRPTPSAAASSIEQSLAMCTALAPRIGYDNAAAIAKKAYQEGTDVREVALGTRGQDPRGDRGPAGAPRPRPRRSRSGGFPTAEEIEALLDPHGQTVRGTGIGGRRAVEIATPGACLPSGVPRLRGRALHDETAQIMTRTSEPRDRG